jgi:hypothetical protein
VAAEFEERTHIWDVRKLRHVISFATILDFGGNRLAISSDGTLCVTASFEKHGVACYSTDSGNELWRRADVRHSQLISFTANDDGIIVCTDDKSTYILSRMDGRTVNTFKNVHRVIESEWGSFFFQSGDQMKVTGPSGFVRVIPRLKFAELAVAFSPAQVCLSESGGAIRCIEIGSGAEVWCHFQKGHHAIQLFYSRSEHAFFAVDFEYESGGNCRLLRFGAMTGQMDVIAHPNFHGEVAFCFDGSRVVTSSGDVIDSTTGLSVGHLWGV